MRAALSQVGGRYVAFAASPGVGFDCSGLTMWAWGQAGVSLPHYSRAQYASLPHVPLDQLQPGDLVFMGSPIHHVGMYIGNGQMVARRQPSPRHPDLADPRPRRRRSAGLMVSLAVRGRGRRLTGYGQYRLRPCFDGASGAICLVVLAGCTGGAGAADPDDHDAHHTRRPPRAVHHSRRRRLPTTTTAPRTSAAGPPTSATRSAGARCATGLAAALVAVGCPLVWSSARPGMETAEGAVVVRGPAARARRCCIASLGYVRTTAHIQQGEFVKLIDQLMAAAGKRVVIWPMLGRTPGVLGRLLASDHRRQQAVAGGHRALPQPGPGRLHNVHHVAPGVHPASLPAPQRSRVPPAGGVVGWRGAPPRRPPCGRAADELRARRSRARRLDHRYPLHPVRASDPNRRSRTSRARPTSACWPTSAGSAATTSTSSSSATAYARRGAGHDPRPGVHHRARRRGAAASAHPHDQRRRWRARRRSMALHCGVQGRPLRRERGRRSPWVSRRPVHPPRRPRSRDEEEDDEGLHRTASTTSTLPRLFAEYDSAAEYAGSRSQRARTAASSWTPTPSRPRST